VNIGDHLDGAAHRRSHARVVCDGFFRDVELRRDGNTLLVVVVERPSIAKFEIKGNKDIKTEDLQKSCATWVSPPARPSTVRCSTR
jgi:outer membrane protein insertion porin family